MKKTTKSTVIQIIVFAMLFTLVIFLEARLEDALMQGKSIEERIKWIGFWDWIYSLSGIGILFWAAFTIVKKFVRPSYWKIAFTLLAIVLIRFHIDYIYMNIDYYWIKGLSPEKENALESLGNLVNFDKPSVPDYRLSEIALRPFTDLQYITDFISVFYNFLFGLITMPLWISGIVYFVLRRKKKPGDS